MSGTSTPLTAERLVAAHQKIKATQAAFHREIKSTDDEYERKLDIIENHLLGILNKQGQDSFTAAGCTVYRHTNIIPNASDWPTIYAWIEANEAWDMLERRIKKTFVTQYMEVNKGKVPPGVSVMRKFEAKVRRAPTKKEKVLTDD